MDDIFFMHETKNYRISRTRDHVLLQSEKFDIKIEHSGADSFKLSAVFMHCSNHVFRVRVRDVWDTYAICEDAYKVASEHATKAFNKQCIEILEAVFAVETLRDSELTDERIARETSEFRSDVQKTIGALMQCDDYRRAHEIISALKETLSIENEVM